MRKSASYQKYLIKSLKDPEEALGYLNACLEDDDIRVFYLALHNVVTAQGGVSKLAKKTHKSRASLYKALSLKGNPYFKSTHEILNAIGLHFKIEAKPPKSRGKKTPKAA